MKVAKSILNKIVNEEYSRAVSRRKRATQALSESSSGPSLAPHHLAAVEVDDLVEFANLWAKSGAYVQENVQQLMTGEFDDIDPGAIQEASCLRGFHPDVDEAFSEYEKHVNGGE